MRYSDVDKEMAKAFKEWEERKGQIEEEAQNAFVYRPGVYAKLRQEVLDEISHRINAIKGQ